MEHFELLILNTMVKIFSWNRVPEMVGVILNLFLLVTIKEKLCLMKIKCSLSNHFLSKYPTIDHFLNFFFKDLIFDHFVEF